MQFDAIRAAGDNSDDALSSWNNFEFCAFDATLCLRSLALDCNAGTKKADTALDAERGAAG